MSARESNVEDQKMELELICTQIQSAERSTRQRALKQLQEVINKCENDDDLIRILDATYLDLVKGYSGKYESCRSHTMAIVSQLLNEFENQNHFFLEYVIPTMRRRIGLPELNENSEELQLQLLEQLFEIVEKFSSNDDADHLMQAYNDIIDILVRNLSNRYANAQRQTCEVIKKLATATKSFHMRAECLVDPLIELLSHKRSAIRALAVETLGIVCLHITNKNDKIVKSIVSISPLLMDTNPSVRRMCGIVGCKWLMELIDRYSFCERIMPLVLCCLKDDLAQIRDEIGKQFIRCGQQYYQENEKELQKLTLIDNEFPCSNYTETISIERPTLGCRALVQRSLRMITIIVNELIDWKESVRLHSLKLLWEVVHYSERIFTPKFIDVFPVLAKCCQDDEQLVVKEAQRVALLMGQLLNYDDWLSHAMQSLNAYPTNLGLLRCFSSLFCGADPIIKRKSVESISKLVSTTEMSHSLKRSYQDAILELAEQMVVIYLNEVNHNGENITNELPEEKYLFEILVRTIALSNAHDDDAITKRGTDIFDRFCCTIENRVQLQKKYTSKIIEDIEDLDCEHSELSERIIMLGGCIKLCGFRKEYFQSMKIAIKMVLENCTAHAQVKILAAIAIAMLSWESDDIQESVELLTIFIEEILKPCLIWRAGREAEAIRSMATQVLLSISDACPNEANEIFPKLGKLLSSLSEDESSITRAYAVRCILKAGAFSFEDYQQLIKDLLNKLDDPCAIIRCNAVECLAEIKADSNDLMFDETSYSNHASMIISRLILYLDDPFVEIRPVLLESLEKLGKRHPVEFQKEIDKLSDRFPYSAEIAAIKTKLRDE